MQKNFTRKQKLWKIMKICAIQGMMAFVLTGVLMAHDNYGQVLDRPVSIHVHQADFEEALKEIEKAAQVRFFYSIDQLRFTETISIQADREPLRVVLDKLLLSRHISYKVHEKDFTIILKKEEPQDTQTDLRSPSDRLSEDQPALVTGRVIADATQQPLPGVNVVVKGTTAGTSTDSDGRYALQAQGNDILVFSFIGFTALEQRINDRKVIDVTLQEDIKNLEEVVVNAGYWQVKEKEGTGNISRVTASDISKQPVSNPLLALQGRMAGVVITPRTGVAGSALNVQIRGQNSLRPDGNYPLYVIDGVPVDSKPIQSLNSIFAGGIDPLNTINPENIESIEVLKDADATAIYGSRGANGVILITTKKGKKGNNDLDVQVYSGAGKVSRSIEMMNIEQYLQMRNEAFANDGPAAQDDLNNPDNAIYYPDLKVWDQKRTTNWQKTLFGETAHITDAQVSLSAGTSNTSFRFGGGFHNESTVFPGDFGYRKGTANLSLSHSSPGERFKFALTVNYGSDMNRLFNSNPVYTALTLSPNAPGYDSQGNLDWTGYDFYTPNPFSQMKIQHKASSHTLITSSRFSYEILHGLKAIANVGYTDNLLKEIVNNPSTSMPPFSTAPISSSFGNRIGQSWLLEPQLSYSKTLAASQLDILLGTTWQSSSSNTQWIKGVGYLNDNLLGSITGASQILKLSSDDIQYKYNAIFGRIGYNWNETYFLNLTTRRDGSSRFGPNRKFANFGAVGTAWIFSNESFMRNNVGFISFGKLRASYGATGNDQIGDYGYLSTFSPSSFAYQGNPVLQTTALANPDYAWEINKKGEVGLELGVLRNRLLVTASWYVNRSSNQLVGYALPALTGFTSVMANLNATVQNTGFEFTLTSKNIESNQFTWTTAFNLTIPHNELLAFPNLASSSYANTYVVGQPLTIQKVYQSRGVDPEFGRYRFNDVDGNGVINAQDKTTFINFARQFYGGISNTVSFKSFDVSFFFEFVEQRVRGYMGTFLQAPGSVGNQPAFIVSASRWQNIGDISDIQKFTNDNTDYDNARSSDANSVDGSFLRLKTLSFSYRLPSALCNKIHLKNTSLFVNGQNLFMATKYVGFDPEIPGNTQLPQLRVVTAGIKFKI